MNAWPPHESLTASNGFPDATATPNLLDAEAMFASNAPFQNPHLQQQQPQRANTPQFPYQVNPVVPSKRPRPGDDGVQASPRQHSMNLNLSRSQTPQQAAYPGGFQGNHQPGQPMQAPTPFQHLQHGGSGNATPSPTLQSQQFRPPQPPRMQTVSPNPAFSHQPQGLGMSPPPDPSARVTTPQNPQFSMPTQMGGQPGAQMGPQMGGMNMMPGTSMPGHFNQNFGTNQNMNATGMAGAYPAAQVNLPPNLAQQQAQTQRMYQLKQQQLQQQQHQMMLAAQQQRQQAAAMNPAMSMAQHQGLGTPSRPQGMNLQQQQRLVQNQTFVRKVQQYMQSLNRPINPSPTVSGRQIMLSSLFQIVSAAQGSRKITSENKWNLVARSLGFPDDQFPTAGAEVKHVFEQCLGPYEAAYYGQQTPQQKAMMEAKQHSGQMAGMLAQQMSPTRTMSHTPQAPVGQSQQQYMQQLQQRMQHQPQSAMGLMTPAQNHVALPQANGWSTPQNDLLKQPQLNQPRPSVTRQLEGSPAQGQQPGFPSVSPVLDAKAHDHADSAGKMQPNGVSVPKPSVEQPVTNYQPNSFKLSDSWGPIVESHGQSGEKIAYLAPKVPEIPEMGAIDLRALSLSLQSGIHGEVRYALDILFKLSLMEMPPELEPCDDLVDIILDCASDQIEELAEEAAEVSEDLHLMSYEDVARSVKLELVGLQEIPEVGTTAYNLDRAADRVLAVTTILRNFSFNEKNLNALSSPPAVKFLSNTIQLLGTRNMLLRTHVNTQNFMTDVVTLLSNIADQIILSSRDEAATLLQFLLAFAPTPDPSSSQPLCIPLFNPRVHRYYPLALDSLAKILVRDDPNRNRFKQLFHETSAVPPTAPIHQQYSLLTRSFAMAVAVVPDRLYVRTILPKPEEALLRISEARKPSLTQGMLAADILAGLLPPNEPELAAAFVNAEDGWAPSLFRLVCTFLSQRREQLGPNGVPIQSRRQAGDDQGFSLIGHRAFSMLRKLEDRAMESLSRKGRKLESRDAALVNGDDPRESANGSDDAIGLGGQLDGTSDERAITETEAQSALTDGADRLSEDSYIDEDYERSKFWACVAGEVLPRAEIVLGSLVAPYVTQDILKDLQAMLQLGGGL